MSDPEQQQIPEIEGNQNNENQNLTLNFNAEYEKILSTLDQKISDLKEIWDDQLGQRQYLEPSEITEVAIRYKEWIDVQLQDQTIMDNYFAADNLHQLTNQPESISFEQMIQMFQAWLETVYNINPQGSGQNPLKDDPEGSVEALNFNQSSIAKNEMDNISKLNNQPSTLGREKTNISMTDQMLLNQLSKQGAKHSSAHSSNVRTTVSEMELGPNYKHNQELIDDFFNSHEYDLYNYFTEFAQNNQGGGPRVAASDIPLICRIGFYIDNITFHATKDDKEQLFNKPNCNKYILDLVENYSEINGKINEDSYDVNRLYFSFLEFQDFLDYMIRQNKAIYLRHTSDQKWAVEEEQKAEQEKLEFANSNPVRRELKANIQKYKLLLAECKTDDEKKVVKSTLETLLGQLKQLDAAGVKSNNNNRSSVTRISQQNLSIDGKLMTREQTRQKHLQEIFHFYCRQQYANGTKITFERIGQETTVLNLAKFIVFCQQFKILNYNHKVTKPELQTLFKKTGEHFDYQTLDEFQLILEKISAAMFDNSDEESSNFERLQRLYKYVSLDLPSAFRKHMQIINTPFNIRDQQGFRLLPQDIGREIKLHHIDERTQQELKKYKDDRMNLIQKIKNEEIMPPTQSEIRVMTKKNSNASVPNLQQPHRLVFQNYQQERAAKHSLGKEEDNQVSWQKLERISFSDMKQMKQSAFKPQDLFDEEEDQEDKIYLAQYNLNQEKERKAIQQEENRQGAQVYGVIKPHPRPTQQSGTGGSNQNNLKEISIQSEPILENPANMMKLAPNSNNHRHMNSVGAISEQTKARANQIDDIQQKQEKDMLEQVMQRNQYQIGRGILAARKNQVV